MPPPAALPTPRRPAHASHAARTCCVPVGLIALRPRSGAARPNVESCVHLLQLALEEDGIDLAEAGRKLASTIPTIISMPFNLEWPAFLLGGAMKELTERIGHAQPSPAQLSMRQPDRGGSCKDGAKSEASSRDVSFKDAARPEPRVTAASASSRAASLSLDASLGGDLDSQVTEAMQRRRQAHAPVAY